MDKKKLALLALPLLGIGLGLLLVLPSSPISLSLGLANYKITEFDVPSSANPGEDLWLECRVKYTGSGSGHVRVALHDRTTDLGTMAERECDVDQYSDTCAASTGSVDMPDEDFDVRCWVDPDSGYAGNEVKTIELDESTCDYDSDCEWYEYCDYNDKCVELDCDYGEYKHNHECVGCLKDEHCDSDEECEDYECVTVEQDSDGDGIIDSEDQCPNEASSNCASDETFNDNAGCCEPAGEVGGRSVLTLFHN